MKLEGRKQKAESRKQTGARAKTLGFTQDELYTLAYAARDRFHRTAALCGVMFAIGRPSDLTAQDAAAEYALTERMARVAFVSQPYAPGF